MFCVDVISALPLGGSYNLLTFTHILGYSDALKTREKCNSKQIFAGSDTFW